MSKSSLMSRNSDANLFGHADAFAVDQCQHLIVVHHGVHALDPQRVDGSVEHDPLFVELLVCARDPHYRGHHAVRPLAGVQVEFAVQFAERQRFRVQRVLLSRGGRLLIVELGNLRIKFSNFTFTR